MNNGKDKGHPRPGHKVPEGEMMYSSTLSLTSALDESGWSTPRPRPLYLEESPGTHCIGGWVGPEPVWKGAENLAPTGIRSPGHPARSESLYRLSYPGPHIYYCAFGMQRNRKKSRW